MSTLVNQLGWTLLQFAWQGALIAAVAALGMAALRNSRPQARYALACSALLACLAWPVLTLTLRLLAVDSVQPAVAGLADAGAAIAGARSPLDWLHAHLGAIVLTWAACACALSLRMALGLWWIARAVRSERRSAHWQARVDALARQFGMGRAVSLRIVDGIASPLTAGWWRPVVLLPASLITGLPADLLDALLAHELAHIRRADYLVNLLQNVVETLLFYHPAVWWLSKRIRHEREHIADDLAARQVGTHCLALALSELEKRQFSHPDLALGANGGDLMERITRLLRPARQPLAWKTALPLLALSAALVAGCAQLPGPAAPSAIATTATTVDTRAMVNFASCAKPVWPEQALRDGNTGAVVLGFLVDRDGKVLDSAVRQSSGFTALDEAARVGIAKCSFKPAMAGGQAVQGWAQMQYTWALK